MMKEIPGWVLLLSMVGHVDCAMCYIRWESNSTENQCSNTHVSISELIFSAD